MQDKSQKKKAADRGGAMRRLWSQVKRPLYPLADPASKLSEALDRAIADPESATDPTVAAILRSAPPAPMPTDLRQRSWNALEQELFQAPAVFPPLAVPFRDRARPAGHSILRVPRIALAGTIAVALALTYGAWRGPILVAQSLVRASTRQWSVVRSFDADVQFVSLIPGKQMQWSGRQIYGGPGRTFLQVDLMGVPLRLVVNGARAAADVSNLGTNSETLARLRFVAWAMDPDLPERLLRYSPHVRYTGQDAVLGEPCRVVSFTLDEARGQALPGLPRSVVSGRVWLSMDRRLPMQLELYRADGAAEISYRYSHVTYNVTLRPHLFDTPLKRRDRPIALRVVTFGSPER